MINFFTPENRDTSVPPDEGRVGTYGLKIGTSH